MYHPSSSNNTIIFHMLDDCRLILPDSPFMMANLGFGWFFRSTNSTQGRCQKRCRGSRLILEDTFLGNPGTNSSHLIFKCQDYKISQHLRTSSSTCLLLTPCSFSFTIFSPPQAGAGKEERSSCHHGRGMVRKMGWVLVSTQGAARWIWQVIFVGGVDMMHMGGLSRSRIL